MTAHIGHIYDKQHEIHDMDLGQRFGDMEKAQKKLEKANKAFIAHMRHINHEPPTPTTIQNAVQKTSDYSALTSVLVTAGVATAQLLVSSNPYTTAAYGAISLGHQAFDAMGGYEWLGKKVSYITGWSEQAGLTTASALRIGVHAASIFYGVKRITSSVANSGFALPSFSWAGIKSSGATAYQGVRQAASSIATNGPTLPSWPNLTSIATPLINFASQARATGTKKILQYGMKGSIALGAGFSTAKQVTDLRAHKKTAQGQYNEAESRELLQNEKDARSALTSASKGAKLVQSDTRRIEEILDKIVQTKPNIAASAA